MAIGDDTVPLAWPSSPCGGDDITCGVAHTLAAARMRSAPLPRRDTPHHTWLMWRSNGSRARGAAGIPAAGTQHRERARAREMPLSASQRRRTPAQQNSAPAHAANRSLRDRQAEACGSRLHALAGYCIHPRCDPGTCCQLAGSLRLAPPVAPSLLLFLHIEKTGGSTVMEWLARNVRPRDALARRLSMSVRYPDAECFMCDQFGLLDCGRSPACKAGSRNFFMCNGAQFSRPSWDQLQVAVEFHAYAKAFFQSTVVPRLGELRALYEGAGGTVVVMTLLREPVSHLISVYQMWPPVRPYESERNRLPTLDFAAWARGTAGVQVAALGAQNLLRMTPMVRGMHTTRSCAGQARCIEACDHLSEAIKMLSLFDVVGTPDCMQSALLAAGAKLRLRRESSSDGWLRMSSVAGRLRPRELIRESPRAVHPGQAVYEASRVRWEQLNASARDEVLNVVGRCDLALYRSALERAEQTLPGRRGQCNQTRTPVRSSLA